MPYFLIVVVHVLHPVATKTFPRLHRHCVWFILCWQKAKRLNSVWDVYIEVSSKDDDKNASGFHQEIKIPVVSHQAVFHQWCFNTITIKSLYRQITQWSHIYLAMHFCFSVQWTCAFRTLWDQHKVSWLLRSPDFLVQFTCKWLLWDHNQVSWLTGLRL